MGLGRVQAKTLAFCVSSPREGRDIANLLPGAEWAGRVAQTAQGLAALLTSCSPATWSSSCPAGK